MNYRRLSYPWQSCVPTELRCVSLSGAHYSAALIRIQIVEVRRHAPKNPGGSGAEPLRITGKDSKTLRFSNRHYCLFIRRSLTSRFRACILRFRFAKKSQKPASDPRLDSFTIYGMNLHPITTPASPSPASPIFDASFDSIESLTTSFVSPVVPTLETTTVTEVALGYHRNQQYSITAMTTSTGAVAERYAYTAYGQPTILNASGTVLTSSAVGNRYMYTGREWDETLGLHHFRARWMSPLAGRFLGRDPIGYEDGGNLYCAVFSMRKSLDPTGTHTWPVFVHPLTAPRGVPWSDGKCDDPLAYACTQAHFRIKGCECKKCKCGGYYIDGCRIWLDFKITINLDLLKRLPPPPPVPADPNYKEPDYTYGHEQRHVENYIADAKRLNKDLIKKLHSQTCIANQEQSAPIPELVAEGDKMAKLQCELAITDLVSGMLEEWRLVVKREKDHQSPHPVDGDPYPPIGDMPDPS